MSLSRIISTTIHNYNNLKSFGILNFFITFSIHHKMTTNSLHLRRNFFLTFLIMALPLLISSCSDDEPESRSEYDIVGIWQDSADHILDIVDPDKIYEYSVESFGNVDYWIKRKEMYFFEPYSYLLMKADMDGIMQIYKVVSVDEKQLTLCWVATPDTSGIEDSDDKFQIFSFFFKEDYVVDPANYVVYKKLTSGQLSDALEGSQVIEL